MIPKIIHYCWFGSAKKPYLVLKCIESWKRHMPDYEIKEWNENNIPYVEFKFYKEAIENKKYAFASDLARIVILKKYGGIYLDTDVFLYKSIEPLLNKGFVSFIEYIGYFKPEEYISNGNRKEGIQYVKGLCILAAFLASVPDHPFINSLFNEYYEKPFKLGPNCFNEIAIDWNLAVHLEKYGFKYVDCDQILKYDGYIYNSKLLGSQMNSSSSAEYGIHCCMGSWIKKPIKEKFKNTIKIFLIKLNLYYKLFELIYGYSPFDKKIYGKH